MAMDLFPRKGFGTYTGVPRAAVIGTKDGNPLEGDELDRALEAAEDRRVRMNQLEEALANGQETDEAWMVEDFDGKLYASDGRGQISVPTDLNRPFTEEEQLEFNRATARGDDAAMRRLFDPERRARGRCMCRMGFWMGLRWRGGEGSCSATGGRSLCLGRSGRCGGGRCCAAR